MPSKNAVLFFRAEPRLATIIKRKAAENEVSTSEYLRDLVRAALGIRPDYPAQHDSDNGDKDGSANLH